MQSKNTFLPPNYEVPSGPSNYLRFEQGENKFRILASPLLGLVGWKKNDEGQNRPIRVPQGESMPIDKVDEPEKVRHFWAMPVYNYKTKSIQILEITQKGIQKTIRSLAKDKDWGSPLNYNLSIIRTGEGLDTEYQTIPSPPTPLDKSITAAYEMVDIDLEKLFTNEDPFGVELTKTQLDDIEK